MRADLSLVVLLACALFAALAVVYVYSADHGRRRRAYQLIKLLTGRR